MIGYPKHINTKEDLAYVLAEFPEAPHNKAFLQSLLADRFGWYPCAEHAADDTHKIIEATEMVPLSWYELRENTTALIFQMGLTVAEVENMLAAV